MTTDTIVNELRNRFETIHKELKALAPQNTTYVSNFRGKLAPFIFVEGRRVFGNTNNLFNSVEHTIIEQGNNLTSRVYVDSSKVPYYEKAVLSPTIQYARHYGRSEYGSIRYAKSVERVKKNRNYLYYMSGAVTTVLPILAQYNGKEFKVTDSINKYKG
jgi:hypothetical protein